MTSGNSGKVVPVFGNFKEDTYVKADEEEEISDTYSQKDLEEFGLFDFSQKGIEKQAILLYHESIFDVENELLDCKIVGNDKFLKDIEKGEYSILYYSEEGFINVENFHIINEHIYFTKEKKTKKVKIDGREYSLIVIESKEPRHENVMVESIEFSSSGSPRELEYVGNGTTEYDVSGFNVFGDTLALYSECYIGMDSYFSKRDSKITMTFDTQYIEKYVGLVKKVEKSDLKIIKRKNQST